MGQEQKEFDDMMAEMGVDQDNEDVLAMYNQIEADIAEDDFEHNDVQVDHPEV